MLLHSRNALREVYVSIQFYFVLLVITDPFIFSPCCLIKIPPDWKELIEIPRLKFVDAIMLIVFRFTHSIMRLIAAPFSFDHATVMGCWRGHKTSEYVRALACRENACVSK